MNMLQNLARWYFSKRALPFWVILLLDCLMVVGAAILVAVLVEGPMGVMDNSKVLAMLIPPLRTPYTNTRFARLELYPISETNFTTTRINHIMAVVTIDTISRST